MVGTSQAMMSITSREFLTRISDEDLANWFNAVLRTLKDEGKLAGLKTQFEERGYPTTEAEVKYILTSAREQIENEFKSRNIPLPS